MSGLGLAAWLVGAASVLSLDGNAVTTPVALSARVGDRVVIEGTFHSSLDGSQIDPAHVSDAYLGKGSPTVRPEGMFDWERGGLQLIERDWAHHRVVAIVIAKQTAACKAAGIDGPCIVPRIDVLAHERLVPRAAFLSSLRGGISVTTVRPLRGLGWLKAVIIVSLAGVGLVLFAWGVVAFRSRNEAWRHIAREARLLAKDARSLPNGAVVQKRVESVVTAAKRTIAMIKRVDHEARTAPTGARAGLAARRQALVAELRRTVEQLSSVRLRLALGFGDLDRADAALDELCSEVAIGEAARVEANAVAAPR